MDLGFFMAARGPYAWLGYGSLATVPYNIFDRTRLVRPVFYALKAFSSTLTFAPTLDSQGWMGCGCGWEHGGKMPCDFYEHPAELELDYGAPTGLCTETAESSGVGARPTRYQRVIPTLQTSSAYKLRAQMFRRARLSSGDWLRALCAPGFLH